MAQNTKGSGADDHALADLIQPVRRALGRAFAWSVVSALMWPVQTGFVAYGLAGLLGVPVALD